MSRVTSKDGTSIAYERQGQGQAVILVGGGITDRSENAPLAAELAAHFTVYNYDRRGRGLSGDAPRYAVQREIEDIEALLIAAGGSAHLYGVSSGGALLLEAAAAGLPGINRLAVYEVPYDMADDWPHLWRDYVRQLETALAENRRGDAFELFMRLAGSSDEDITGARNSPMWPGLEAIAHTLAYDAACLGNGQPPVARFANITQPTLVATGGNRMPGSARWIRALDPAADAIVASIPNARRQIIVGQSHVAEPKVISDVLKDFFHR
ncbi:alpha/beta fold hydrolase [Actinoplanes sp. NPDC051513]|uniref:alpha/beta fold hydrolase n=1 Tax=Actinoplanes sp. NPDC051513 TaxID=3363908 RepID=UPI0037B67CC6